MRRALLALFVAATFPAALPAAAQSPAEFVTAETNRRFQVCRAAVFYHLDDKTRGASTLPVSLARTLGEQIEFVMQEGVLNKPFASIDEGAAVLRFAESWFIGFTQVLREERGRLLDPAQRDRILIDCIPVVWTAQRSLIDYLIVWRHRAIGAPSLPDPAEDRRRQEETLRRLTR